MPDLWFFAGLAMGIVIAGFSAVGAFDRGADSVRRTTWSRELVARQTTATSRAAARRVAGSGITEPRAALSQRLAPSAPRLVVLALPVVAVPRDR